MNNPTTPFRLLRRATLCTAAFSLLVFSAQAWAASATWNLNASTGTWNTATNWTPATVPNGPSDIATFDVSTKTNISVSSDTEVDGIVFNPAASGFTISPGILGSLTLSGSGVVNNSGLAQTFEIPIDASNAEATIDFFNNATAGTNTVYTVSGTTTGQYGATINFYDESTADHASFIIGAGLTVGGDSGGGQVHFYSNSTAGSANFVCQGSGDGVGGIAPQVIFYGGTAGNATLVAEGSDFESGQGGRIELFGEGDGGDATLIATGAPTSSYYRPGRIYISENGTGGRATVKLLGSGVLDISTGPFTGGQQYAIGSLEGDGQVTMGGRTLVVGANNKSTTFRGRIYGDIGGGLIKVGTGTFTLTNDNKFIDRTRIKGGRLNVDNRSGSATGKAAVIVLDGTLGGSGAIAGAVTIGASGGQARLEPGKAGPTSSLLTIRRSLTINSDGTCQLPLNSNNGTAGGVAAAGVTINSGFFAANDIGSTALPAGTVFTVINNTAATPISGTFSNLRDGSTLVVGPNTFQVNYEGGDGNALTLTVVSLWLRVES